MGNFLSYLTEERTIKQKRWHFYLSVLSAASTIVLCILVLLMSSSSCMMNMDMPTIDQVDAVVYIEGNDLGLYQTWEGKFNGDPWWVSGDVILGDEFAEVCYDWPGESMACDSQVASSVTLTATEEEIISTLCIAMGYSKVDPL